MRLGRYTWTRDIHPGTGKRPEPPPPANVVVLHTVEMSPDEAPPMGGLEQLPRKGDS